MIRKRRRLRKTGERREFFVVSITAMVTLAAIVAGCRSTYGETQYPNASVELVTISSEETLPLENFCPIEIGIVQNDVEVEEDKWLSDKVPLDYTEQTLVRVWCEQYEVPYSIALAVIQTESNFTPEAENGTCKGYMQINTINAEWLMEEIGVTDLDDPHQNLQSGIFILGDLYERYEDWHMALTAYNLGPTGAYNHVFSKGLTSSQYSRLVMERQEEWLEVVADD